MRISDWSSDVCSSDLVRRAPPASPSARRTPAPRSWPRTPPNARRARPPPPAARAATDRHAARPTRRRRPCRRAGSCACIDYPAVPTSTQEPVMQTRPLGRTGLEIAPLALGGHFLGWTLEEAASFELLDAFVDRRSTRLN